MITFQQAGVFNIVVVTGVCSWEIEHHLMNYEVVLNFSGKGLCELWKNYEGNIQEIPIEDQGCRLDVDVPEDYKKVCHYLLN